MNIVPVIAKADTLTQRELKTLKANVILNTLIIIDCTLDIPTLLRRILILFYPGTLCKLWKVYFILFYPWIFLPICILWKICLPVILVDIYTYVPRIFIRTLFIYTIIPRNVIRLVVIWLFLIV